jgi:dihydroorotase
MSIDLLLKNGTLLDPSQSLRGKRDLAVAGDRVSRIAERIDERSAVTLDLAGKLVTPGLVDLHVHTYLGVSHYGIDADTFCLGRGVTTALDAGSAGGQTLEGFRRYVAEPSRTRLFALVNLACQGMITKRVGELEELRYADVDQAVQACMQNRGFVKGVKVRLTPNIVGDNAASVLSRALEVAKQASLPLMIHPNGSLLALSKILSGMRPGDILTHCYHGWSCGILDSSGKVLPEVRAAVDRGILLDVGHGKGSFVFRVARRALELGVPPSTISSDLHTYNINGPVYDLVTTASKFVALGLELEEVVDRITRRPARFLGVEDLGTLREGAPADIAVFEVREGTFTFEDCDGELLTGSRKLIPVVVVKSGQVVLDNL